jgi:uncharacterized membrane protein (DUF4010 family)
LGVLNPYEIWLMTILIAAISFAGYAAVKVAGPKRGVALAAAAGGLVASTAVTLTLARMAAGNPDRAPLLSGSILLAGAVMFVRILFIVAVLSMPLAAALLPSLGLAALVSAAGSLWLMRHRGRTRSTKKEDLRLNNPFELVEVLRFGAILTVVMAAAAIAERYLGDAGLLAVAAVSGLADVDALTLSAARMAGTLPMPVPTLAILIAAGSNTAAKAVYAWVAGGSAIGFRVAIGSAIAILCAAIGHAAAGGSLQLPDT